MLKQLLFTTSLVIFTLYSLVAQQSSMQQYIGQDNVLLVVNFQPYTTYQKIDKATKDEYKINELLAPMIMRLADAEITEKSTEKVANQLADPSKVGLSLKNDVYFWIQQPTGVDKNLYEKEKNAYLLNFVLPITDRKKFRSFLNELVANERMQEVIKMGTANTMINDGIVLQWDDRHLTLSTSTLEHNFFEEVDEFQARRTKILRQHAESLLKVDAKQSLATDQEYQATLSKEADFNLWLNYDNLEQDPSIYPMEMRGLMKSLSSLTTGNRLSAQGFFRNGEVEIATNFKMNDAVNRMTEKGYKKGINQKFYQYIDNTNLMGLFTLSTNTTELMTTYGEEVYKAFKNSDAPESKIVVNMLDIVDIFLDEEEIYGLFQGDVAVAVTDLRAIQVERSDFQYDEEADQWDEVTVTKEEVVPIATMMLNLGNAQNIQHFIDLGVNVGGLIEQQKGVWTVKDVKAETGMDFYIIMHDNLLMFSNDANLMKNLNGGFPKNKQLPAAAIQDLSQFTQYAFIDLSKISDVTKKAYEKSKEEAPNELMELAATVSRFEMKSYYPANSNFKSDVRVLLQDKDANVLNLMLKGLGQLIPNGEAALEEDVEMEEEVEDKDVKRL